MLKNWWTPQKSCSGVANARRNSEEFQMDGWDAYEKYLLPLVELTNTFHAQVQRAQHVTVSLQYPYSILKVSLKYPEVLPCRKRRCRRQDLMMWRLGWLGSGIFACLFCDVSPLSLALQGKESMAGSWTQAVWRKAVPASSTVCC